MMSGVKEGLIRRTLKNWQAKEEEAAATKKIIDDLRTELLALRSDPRLAKTEEQIVWEFALKENLGLGHSILKDSVEYLLDSDVYVPKIEQLPNFNPMENNNAAVAEVLNFLGISTEPWTVHQ